MNFILELGKDFTFIDEEYNSNIGCVLVYLQGGTTNEIRM